jgi:hypothetical protein
MVNRVISHYRIIEGRHQRSTTPTQVGLLLNLR